MNFLITICAREGSKGVLNKNIKKLNGRPLIFYTCDFALKLAIHLNEKYTVDIVLSTDSLNIKSVVQGEFSLIDTTYVRPEYLATDSAGKTDAITHVLRHFEKVQGKNYDYIIDLDVTSPLRTLSDLETAFKILNNNPSAYNIFSVSEAHKNPYFNLVETGENCFAELSKRGNFFSRQAAPPVYEINGSFYIYRATFFNDNLKKATTSRSLIYKMPHICFDIDTPLDFEFMDYLFSSGKIDDIEKLADISQKQ
ncbi:acylneuraminate cytidylyltransferase family protein [Niabella aquatica]